MILGCARVAVHTVIFYSSIQPTQLVEAASPPPFGAKMVA